MLIRRHAAVAAVIFTILVLASFNFGWWWYYNNITSYMEDQLSQRLTDIAAGAALHIEPQQVESLLIDDLDEYLTLSLYLDSLAIINSLSEASLIDIDFNYLVSPQQENLTDGYLLASLNFDSLHQAVMGHPVASALYVVDETYLKSAYAPVYDSLDQVTAIVVVEAGASYFNLLDTLRGNLYLLAGGSAGIVVILLVFFIFYSRRLASAEEKIFKASSQAALGRMVAVVSHEVKNPLMIIAAAGERLQKKYSDPEAAFISEEVERLNRIVSGYLDFAKNNLTYHREEIDLKAFCDRILDRYSEQFVTAGVKLEKDTAANTGSVKGDPVALRQVIVNLILNGLEATTGNESVNNKFVRLTLSNSDPRDIIIRVTDNGAGFKAADRRKLFEPFFTTKTAGSGLGLYLSRRIIEAHEGTIRLVPDGDKNDLTTIEVRLPRGVSR